MSTATATTTASTSTSTTAQTTTSLKPSAYRIPITFRRPFVTPTPAPESVEPPTSPLGDKTGVEIGTQADKSIVNRDIGGSMEEVQEGRDIDSSTKDEDDPVDARDDTNSGQSHAERQSLQSTFRCTRKEDEILVRRHLDKVAGSRRIRVDLRGDIGQDAGSSAGSSLSAGSGSGSDSSATIDETAEDGPQEGIAPNVSSTTTTSTFRPSRRKALSYTVSAVLPGKETKSNGSVGSAEPVHAGSTGEDPYQMILRGCLDGRWKGEGNYRSLKLWPGKDGSSSSSSSGGSVPVSTISTRSAANAKKAAAQSAKSKQKKGGSVGSKSADATKSSAKDSNNGGTANNSNKSALVVPGLTTTVPSPSPLRMAYSQPNSPEEEGAPAGIIDRLDPLRAIRALSESGMGESSKKRRRPSGEDDEDSARSSLAERAGSSPPAKRQVRASATSSSVVGKRISPRLSHAMPVRYENGLGSDSTSGGAGADDDGDHRRGRSGAPESGVGSGQPTDASGLGKMLLRREVERKKRAATHSPPGVNLEDEQEKNKKSPGSGMRRTLSHDTVTMRDDGEVELGMAAGRSRREVGPPKHLRDYEMEIAV